MKDAWRSKDAALAKRELERLANSLAKPHPGAAASLRDGLAETLTLRGWASMGRALQKVQ